MSNIKRIDAVGICPFDFANAEGSRYDHKAHDAAMVYLGGLNLPTVGMGIKFGKTISIPWGNGGKYCHYSFTITGEEAFGYGYFEELIKRFEAVGCRFERFWIMDVQWPEEEHHWENVAVTHDTLHELQQKCLTYQ